MKYRIKPGFTLVDSDGSLKTGGELIDLSNDFAQAHPDKVEPAVLPIEAAATDAHALDVGLGY